MNSEKLLEAIGEIRDEYIEEATPGKRSHKNWMKYAALAACFCICMVAVLKLGSGIFSMGKMESAAPKEDCFAEESAVEEAPAAVQEGLAEMDGDRANSDLTEETELEEAPAAEESPSEDVPAEDEAPEGGWPEDEAPAEDNSEEMHDITYGIYFDDILYFPISFQERKDYGLIDSDAIGLTPENTYQITEADLGGVIGTVEDCPGNPDMIGCTIYQLKKFPNDRSICIIDVHGTYEFYVAE